MEDTEISPTTSDDFNVEIPGEGSPLDVLDGSGRTVELSPGQVIIIDLDVPGVETFLLTFLRFVITGARRVIVNFRITPPSGPPFDERISVSSAMYFDFNT